MIAEDTDKTSTEPSEEDMAAEWEAAMTAEGSEGTEGEGEENSGAGAEGNEGHEEESARTLSQDEIDSLLGVSSKKEKGQIRGVDAIVNSSLVAYERLPMLDVVFDRLVRLMSTSLRNFTSDNVEVAVDKVQTIRFGEYLNAIPLPAMISVFKAYEWDNYGIMTVDGALIYSIVDVLLGGRRGSASTRVEGRPYTTIERGLVERMIRVVLQDLSSAFDPLSPVTFKFERLETNPRFATVTRTQNASIVVTLQVDMEDRGGKLDIVLPNATLEPIREILLQMFMGEKFGRDSIWETHLVHELWTTDVEIEAILDEMWLPLHKVLEWEVGSQLMLNASPNDTLNLACGNVTMFRGKMGKRKNSVAVKIEKVLQNKDQHT